MDTRTPSAPQRPRLGAAPGVADPAHRVVAPSTAPARLWWVDLVRALSLGVVVLGHVLIAMVVLRPGHDGGAPHVEATSLLDVATWSHPVTWVVQVMACFFAVGAVVASPGLRAGAEGRAAGHLARWRGHVVPRARGLVIPALPLMGVWALLAPAIGSVAGAEVARVAAGAALVPLWFLAVYLVVQVLLPPAVAVVERRGVVVPVAVLLAAVGVVDALHLAGAPAVGVLNFALVWMVPTVLGVGVGLRGIRSSRLVVTALVAGACAVGLVLLAGYPVPVVGVTGTARSNNSPPSLLLAVHGLAYAAAVLAVAPRLEGWLAGVGRRRALLAAASRWSMPVYLWHMTGLVVVIGVAVLGDVPVLDDVLALEPLGAAWWLARPVMVVMVLLGTAGCIAVAALPTGRLAAWSARAAERGGAPGPARPIASVGLVLAALGLVVAGIALSITGQLTPAAGLLLAATGAAGLHTGGRQRVRAAQTS